MRARTLAVALVLLCIALPASAQSVLLRIRPRPGDTLHTRLDQSVEMVGTTKMGEADTTMRVLTTMVVLARTIIVSADTSGTTVTTITDSVSIASSGGRSAGLSEQTQAQLQGKRVTMRLAPDGSVEIVGDAAQAAAVSASLPGRMPGTLPAKAISVGESWERVMEVPLAGQPGGGAASALRATFTLDSLAGSRLAYISMRGELSRDDGTVDRAQGVKVSTTGTIVGNMIVDRRLGWLTYSRSVMTVNSVLTPPPGTSDAPMHFRMKVTQRMKTVDQE